uniref:Uncharacterized protein n=1 Tax=Acrobeloides nanus TaxID=290746 RepID=A0A914E9T4_9BILA
MRNRMEEYAREKFSQHYHHFKNISENSTKKLPKKIFKKRDKRDGGLISGPVAMAVVTGMIGMTAKAVTDIVNYHPSVSEGGCEWFGTAPFCNYPCPPESDPRECSWSGRWMGANNAYNSYCRYDNSVGVCGEITCSINHFEFKAQDTSEIYGSKCDQIDMFNATGKATCGYIAWFDSERNLVNSWYKSR